MRYSIRVVVMLSLLGFAFGMGVQIYAQEKAPAPAVKVEAPAKAPVVPLAPTLTMEQKQSILLAAKDKQIAEQQVIIASVALDKLLVSLVPAGYALDAQLNLVPTLKK